MIKGGSGGSHTNAEGLLFEMKTDFASHVQKTLSNKYILEPYVISEPSMVIKSNQSCYSVRNQSTGHLIGIITRKKQFYNVLKQVYGINNVNRKLWEPDDVFFNLDKQTVFVIEKKWQNTTGSTDEKPFGFDAKRTLYQRLFNLQQDEPVVPVQFVAMFNSSWWLDGNHVDLKTGEITHMINPQMYHDYFDALRNRGIKIMYDTYDDWYFGL